jgi:hypothetical protein
MCARIFSGTRRLRAAATAVRPPARKISNHNFEVDPIVPVFWREKEVLATEKYVIDTTNENMMDGPKGNPQERLHDLILTLKIGRVRVQLRG